MSKFVQRALQKLPKLSTEQIHDLVSQLSGRVEKLELVLDSMSEGVVVANLQNQVLLANKAAERLFLLPGIECPQDFKIWELIRYEAINRYVREAMDSQDSFFDREFAVEDKGTHRTLNCRVVPLVQKGAIEGTILTIEDITRRKQREAKLRRYESLASLTTLAAGVAHEIKNPLGSIGIHMQLIEKKLQAVAGSEQ
ncbi:MAG: PAS domain S-box protein, partial [Spirochaetaceae bacterium]